MGQTNTVANKSSSVRADNIKVVVGVDFGTTFSGFGYAHVDDSDYVKVHCEWPTRAGNVMSKLAWKCNTILRYKSDTGRVDSWGREAVAHPLKKYKLRDKTRVVELFNLNLISGICDKPALPEGMDYEKPIIDFLGKMENLIRETLFERWGSALSYPEDVRFVFTVPAEFDRASLDITRKLIHAAGFAKTPESQNLQFTTEPDAAALYCLSLFKQYDLDPNLFLVVDCGGGSVDLTVRSPKKLGEFVHYTERSNAPCGSRFVDEEFIRFLDTKLSASAMEAFRRYHYQSYQCLCDFFTYWIKHQFTGDASDFLDIDLDIEGDYPDLQSCVTDRSVLKRMEDAQWVIPIRFDDVKKMFDPIILQILKLVHGQLDKAKGRIDTLFLVGGFSESKYLQTRIRNEFRRRVRHIICPPHPSTAIIRGAVDYGMRMSVVNSRTEG